MDMRLRNEARAITQVLYGTAICLLIVLGMSGAIYRLIGPQGLLEHAFGAALAGEFRLLTALVAVGVLGLAGQARVSERLKGRIWGGATYFFGMLGVLFAVRFATLGTL